MIMYTHKVSGDTMSREDALGMIHESEEQQDELSPAFGMSDEEALSRSFVETDKDGKEV